MLLRSIAASAVLLAAIACGARDPTGPSTTLSVVRDGSAPTVLITNATCNPGPCESFEVRGMVPKFLVPGQSVGFLDLGPVDSATACLRFPGKLTLTVIGPRMGQTSVGPGDTTVVTWTPDDSISLHAVRSLFVLGRTTAQFAPASSPGWSVALPIGAATPALGASQACAP